MGFNFAEAKRATRQAVHDTLAVDALFKLDSADVPIPISARLHSQLVRQGRIESAGAEVIEGINQVVFDRAALHAIGVYPERGNLIVFPDYQDFTVSLDYRLPYDGPVEEVWTVTPELVI